MKNCKITSEDIIKFVQNELEKDKYDEFNKHINSCNQCKAELEKHKALNNILNNVEEIQPSKKLRLRFEQLLSEEKLKEKQRKNNQPIALQFLKFAATVALIITSFLIGKEQSSYDNPKKVSVNSTEKTRVLAMLNNPSASKRIQAIDISQKLVKDNKIINALISRLYNDKNSNVRLEATKALEKYATEERIRDALIKSLETDDDPVIQIEIIRILTRINEKRAVEPMKKLLKKQQQTKYLKYELQTNIAKLS